MSLRVFGVCPCVAHKLGILGECVPLFGTLCCHIGRCWVLLGGVRICCGTRLYRRGRCDIVSGGQIVLGRVGDGGSVVLVSVMGENGWLWQIFLLWVCYESPLGARSLVGIDVNGKLSGKSRENT